MKRTACTFFALLLPLGALAAPPGDAAAGRRLHDANCNGCHDAGVYTRADRHVRSLDALRDQLGACGHMAKKNLSPAEMRDLVRYLNDRYYRFP